MSVRTASLLSAQYDRLLSAVVHLRRICEASHTASANGLDANAVLQLYRDVAGARTRIMAMLTTELVSYIESVETQPYDASAEFSALFDSCDAVTAFIESAFPTGSGGYLLAGTISGGDLVWRQFSASALSGLRAELQAIIDEIAV